MRHLGGSLANKMIKSGRGKSLLPLAELADRTEKIRLENTLGPPSLLIRRPGDLPAAFIPVLLPQLLADNLQMRRLH